MNSNNQLRGHNFLYLNLSKCLQDKPTERRDAPFVCMGYTVLILADSKYTLVNPTEVMILLIYGDSTQSHYSRYRPQRAYYTRPWIVIRNKMVKSYLGTNVNTIDCVTMSPRHFLISPDELLFAAELQTNNTNIFIIKEMMMIRIVILIVLSNIFPRKTRT